MLERLVTDAVTKADLIDAIAHAGPEVQATVDATSADLHRTLGHLLSRAQSAGPIRADIGIADLMAILSGILLALRHRANAGADPRLALAVLCDGLRAGHRPRNGDLPDADPAQTPDTPPPPGTP
ncbi:hypothetical protein [Streptomyces sp. ADMS]|uniref:SbtR family transcriptional regulator n=1 Tax=Streptomyces sp. ADMS TaxID=3071415 RepID=UPI00399349A3